MNLVSSIQQCTSPITTRALVDHTLFSTELSSRSSHRNGPTMVRMWGRARSPNCSTRSLRWSRRTVFKYSCWTETSPALSHQCVGLFVVCLFVCLFVCLLFVVCLFVVITVCYRVPFFGLQFVSLGCFVCLWLWWWCCLLFFVVCLPFLFIV